MAEFLDKLKVRLDKGLTTVNEKSKEIIGRQKIRLHLSELEAEKKMVFQELGKVTYGSYRISGEVPGLAAAETPRAALPEALDNWEASVVLVLGRLSDGELANILFEDTPRQFKVTAKTLYEEVEKLIPDSEKKGQNLQWLGRVLGKFGIAAKKVSKRIDGERETVYEFDKQKTRSILDSLSSAGEKKGKDESRAGSARDISAITSACARLADIDSRIEKLKKQMKEIGKED